MWITDVASCLYARAGALLTAMVSSSAGDI